MVQANEWSTNQIDLIWWKIHGIVLHRLGHDKRRVIQKYIHNKLPCNTRQHKYYNYKNNLCRACNIEQETQQHILLCTACPFCFVMDLNRIMEKSRINEATTQIICQNASNYLTTTNKIDVHTIALDATKY
jgi:hypothetical protein